MSYLQELQGLREVVIYHLHFERPSSPEQFRSEIKVTLAIFDKAGFAEGVVLKQEMGYMQ